MSKETKEPKKKNKVKRYPHKLAENYPSNSLYNWELFSDKKFKIRQQANLLVMQDHIRNYDMFWAVNDFINYDNEDKDNIFRTEEKLNGLEPLFVLGMVENVEHQEILLKVAYDTIEGTRGSTMTVETRADMVERGWRQRILHL